MDMDEFRRCIEERRLKIVQYLDLLNTPVLDALVSKGVIGYQQLESLRVYRTNHQLASGFLSMMMIKPLDDWKKICKCLDDYHHSHVSKIIKEAMTEAVQAPTSTSRADGIVTSMQNMDLGGGAGGESAQAADELDVRGGPLTPSSTGVPPTEYPTRGGGEQVQDYPTGQAAGGTVTQRGNAVMNPQASDEPQERQHQQHNRTRDANQCYSMEGTRRAIVFNYTKVLTTEGDVLPREGARVDEKTVCDLLHWLGYKVKYFEDLYHADLIKRLQDFARLANEPETQSIFVILMSHGGTENNKPYICTKDGIKFCIRDQIKSTFAAHNHLADKPKIFIIQACQGGEDDPGEFEFRSVAQETPDVDRCASPTYQARRHQFDHYLFAFPTQPNSPAYRNTITGSWFINEIDKVFREHASDMHLADMLTMVNNNVTQNYRRGDGYWQNPEMHVGLKKSFFFR